jgi:ABC-2 type transport system ATP-binding protein
MLVSTHLMDEAERCHRLVVLDRGRLVADGTPAELTRALEGRVVEVVAPQPRRAQRALVGLAGVLSVAQVGNNLRVLIEQDGDAASRVHETLQKAGLQAEVAPVPPNLEDVFADVTRDREDTPRERAA